MTTMQDYQLLSIGITLLLFGILGIIFWVNPTMDATMDMVDEMIQDWSTETDCGRLLLILKVVESKPFASSQRPDMKETLENRISELNCQQVKRHT